MGQKINYYSLADHDYLLDQALAVYIDSFQREEIVNTLLDINEETVGDYQDALAATLKQMLKAGHECVLACIDGKVLGLAILSYPNPENQEQVSSQDKLKTLKEQAKFLKMIRYRNLPRLVKTYPLKSGWRDDHATLEILAVSSKAQGKRIGSGLINHIKDHKLKNSQGLYLTTGNAKTADFYQSFGFQLVEEKSSHGLNVYQLVYSK
ncbi:GNAT family N-acetyltransferase [Aerococcus kribbianus]|uniref:GNAT family N-acetyltransferase n=1 Tax=Aerococcus kribbianus TaxID=2999064 RepID=A0A9X3JEQ0_9LACT|nr:MULTISPECIES: GNAT family N-acetyltransferase [unclassified Aerococcus]MCZ0716838.1 GNAT family N-acetyltransferase [Aerococcus sp. YH-aer221]MCZ0725126.1 GNAT family N-acetyltransferase [Aerococcus sp. YH-aer222]